VSGFGEPAPRVHRKLAVWDHPLDRLDDEAVLVQDEQHGENREPQPLLNCPCGVPEHGKWERVCRDVALKCVLVLVHVDAGVMTPCDAAMRLREQGHLNDARIAPCCPKGKHAHWWLRHPTEADRLPRQVLAL